MTKPIVISVRGEPQGVVVPAEGDFRFVAVKLGVFPIDGRLFKSVAEARHAARAVVEGGEELAESLENAAGTGRNDDMVA